MKNWPSSMPESPLREADPTGGGSCLAQRIQARAEAIPEAVALVWGQERLSYGELAGRARHLARRLVALGVGPETLVALYLDRSPRLVVAALAVFEAGGAYVPLDPDYPPERVAFILEDAAAPLVLTESGRAEDLPAGPARILCLDARAEETPPTDLPHAALAPDRLARNRLVPSRLAYVIYTSGSTGRPKGVAIEHASAVALVDWTREAFRPEEMAGVLAATSICFDLSVFELWTTLALGGTVVLVANALELPRLPGAHAVTLLNTVPSAAAELFRDVGTLPFSLRTVNLAGEPLRRPLADSVYAHPGVERLLNLYGPSEDTTYSTVAVIPRQEEAEPAIGVAVTGTEAHLLDPAGRPVPEGEIGELYLGGAGLARGYLARPAATAERWLPDPFSGMAGARLYRTGDRVSRRSDGELLFHGRLDHQVKIRGFRIELGEIESALTHQEGVREAVVVVREDRPGDRRLIAYVETGARTRPGALRRALATSLSEVLPKYMLPSALVLLAALPRTPNGKVDRNRLGPPGGEDRLGAEAGYTPPRPGLETWIAGLWGEVLGLDPGRRERVGRDDDFLALGGHSLLATRVLSRLRRELGVELPPGALFATPTVATLARAVAAAGGREPGLSSPPTPEAKAVAPLAPGAPEANLPPGPGELRRAVASFDQERLWFLQRLDPQDTSYNVPLGLELAGPLDRGVLRRALGEILRRHEVLRTRLPEVDGSPMQAITSPPPLPLGVVDLGVLPAAARSEVASQVVARGIRRPFDLARGLAFHFLVLHLGPGAHRLVLNLHHIVLDDASTAVLVGELETLYAAFQRRQVSPLPELPIQYADYAAWQRRRMSGPTLEAELGWWRRQLAGAPELLELPIDRPRPARLSNRGGHVRLTLTRELTLDLETLGRSRGATLFMVMLTAWQALLGRLSGQDDVVVVTPITGRTRMEAEGLIGFFLNTLALRVDLGGNPAFPELLSRVRQAALAAYAHADVPFERVVREVAGSRTPGSNPLGQTGFTVQNLAPPEPRLPGVEARWFPLHNGRAKLDLGLELEVRNGVVGGWLEYSLDLFDPTTARRMLGAWERLLEEVVEAPERPVTRLSLLGLAETHQLLREWGDGPAAGGWEVGGPALSGEGGGGTLLTAFADHARRGPEVTAIQAGEEMLSYGELSRRCRALARQLGRRGVGLESVVAVALERRVELPVALLGILAAGGAYLPLDPSHPAERLGLILGDAGVEVMVADAASCALLPGALLDDLEVLDPGAAREGDEAEPADPGNPRPESADPRSLAPQNLAYVLYTSGSTGRPKGVACAHAGVLNLLADFQARATLGREDRGTLWTSLGFDVSVYEIFSVLTAGATLHLVDEDVRGEPGAFLDTLIERAITSAYVPPFMLPELAARAARAALGGSALVLRRLLVGVEPIPEPVLADLDRALPALAVLNGYGPTEATVCATFHRVCHRPGVPKRNTPIGRPVANLDVLVLDRHLGLCPLGVSGEVSIGGPGLARGYLGRPGRTALSFVPHPFSPTPGERLYRTGDLARHLPGGELEFVGRIDFQLKVRGFRIEAGDVEAALARHPGVREAVMVLREDNPGDRRLVAYVAVGPEAPRPEPGELRAHLEGLLPSYMVPSACVVLDELPRTPNDKIDRRALPAPVREAEAGVFETPRTPAEGLVAGVWADVLGREKVGRQDDFFHLGGHSLLATRAAGRIAEAFGVALPLREFFVHPTVASLARCLEELRRRELGEEGRATLPPIPILERPGPDTAESGTFTAPLSPSQERLWFLDRLRPGASTYNIPVALALSGPLRPGVLARALGEIVRRHEALRTSFPASAGEPRQQVHAPFVPALPIVDLRSLTTEGEEGEARRLLAVFGGRPFDLDPPRIEVAPLFRAHLMRLGESWQLALNLHHIIADAWSVGVLLRELGTLYGLLAAGAPVREARSLLAELPVQYPDYAAWERNRLGERELEEQLTFWRRHLGGAPVRLELPTDRPRPKLGSQGGAIVERLLPPSLPEALASRARQEGLTPFMFLLAVFQALLGRIAGQEDLLVGCPIAGRVREELSGLIGFFINTLVLRAELGGDPPFRDLASRTRKTVMDAFAHQDLPFERLVEELHPRREVGVREVGESPLFQVMFVLQENPAGGVVFPGLETSFLEIHSGTAKFDLTTTLVEVEGGLEVDAEYAVDLFDATTIQRFLGYFEVLLEGAVAEPGRRLSELSLLRPGQRHQILAEWNDRRSPYPADASLPALFAAQVRERPEAVATVFPSPEGWDEHVSYRDLARRAGELAGRLRAAGVGPDTPVPLYAEGSLAAVVGMLGILGAGGAYVPLDASYPPKRLGLMLADVGTDLVVVSPELGGKLDRVLVAVAEGAGWEAASPRRIPLATDAGPALLQESSREEFLPAVGGDHLAYVIYTSGSTGRPKGVAVPQRAVARLVLGADYVQLTPEDHVAQVSNLSFDAATFEVWGALLNGGRLVGIPKEAALDPGGLPREFRRLRVAATFLTSALFNQVARGESGAFRSVGHLLVGGEALDPQRVREVLVGGGPRRLLNGYGPTETTTFAVCGWIREVPEGATTVPIGTPIANTWAQVLGPAMEAVPPGVPGQLFLGGPGLARGYLGRPGRTAGVFVPDPFAGDAPGTEPGGRLYRTGDQALRDRAGQLVFLGRLDHQIKLRGFRIEIGEIEGALGTHPEVAEAVVVPREDRPGEKRLVAYLVAAGELRPGRSELRRHLARTLPDYMLPALFLWLPELPLTANKKVDRRALPAPEMEVTAAGIGTPPATPMEHRVAAVWMELLGLSRVHREDDFFALGGHSLLATRVSARLQSLLQVEVSVRDLFLHPTVRDLAAHLEGLEAEGLDAGEGVALPPILPLPRRVDLPLSFAQERLWFLEQMEPGTARYTLPQALRLRGRLDLPCLAGSFGEIVARHELLRTTFPEVEGRPVQRIAPPPPPGPDGALLIPLPVVDLQALPPESRLPLSRDLARREAGRPFDLARGPLLRTSAVLLDDGDAFLLLNLHHIVTDGWSMGILTSELEAYYRHLWESSRGSLQPGDSLPSPLLPELPIQYGDFAVWQRQWLSGDVLAAQLDWWRRHLEGAPPEVELPTDRPRPRVPSRRGGLVEGLLPSAFAGAIEGEARRRGVTPFMFLLAAFQSLLGRISGQEDLVLGIPVAGRGREEVRGLIGFFVNTLALRGRLFGNPTFEALLGRVKEVVTAAFAHQDLPFERLVEELHPRREPGESPLFQVMFVLQETPTGQLDFPELAGTLAEVHPGTSKFDFSASLVRWEGRLEISAEYNADLFDPTTVRRLLGHFEVLLGAAVAEPGRRLSELPLLGEAERHQILSEWNDRRSPYPADASLVALFEEQVRMRPETVAAVYPASEGQDEHLSYRELFRRGRELARRLQVAGVRPDTPVPLYTESSLGAVVGMLGILAAGGAYVPLPTAYPPKRLGMLVADLGTDLVVVSRELGGKLDEVLAEVPRAPAIRRLCLEGKASEEDLEIRPEPWHLPPVGGDHLAYVIYTSGSTGRPKGVAIPQRAVSSLVLGVDYVHLSPETRMAQVSNLSFDAATLEVWGALLNGGRLIGIPKEAVLDPGGLPREFRRLRVSVGALTTALFNQIARGEPAAFRGVGHILVGGEAVDPRRMGEVLVAGRPGHLANAYGPTEATCLAVCHQVRRVPEAATTMPIGEPVTNTWVRVLDPSLRPVPPGVPGELFLGGPGLARGYLGRPARTAGAFVPDPFSGAPPGSEPGSRLYRTGDRARCDRRGEVVFLGRLDHQVKLRGFRIEIGEIEGALGTHPGVAQAVVMLREDRPGQRRLVAYLVAASEERPEREELRRHLLGTLPDYMLPAVFLWLAELPLTINRKVDQRALPAPEEEAPTIGNKTSPATPLEHRLAALWGELLGLSGIGREDDFFDLGGHSLLATQLASRIRATFAVEFAVREIFFAPTLAEQAQCVEGLGAPATQSPGLPEAPPLERISREVELPLSYAQERLWFLQRLDPQSSAYNSTAALDLEGELDVAALGRTLAEIVRRHEVLRTGFTEHDGVPAQVIMEGYRQRLAVVDLSILPISIAVAEGGRLGRCQGLTPFDLDTTDLIRHPLLRSTLFRLSTEAGERPRHWLVLTNHHIVFDGWSVTVILGEMATLYRACRDGRPSPLPELAVQYADFAVWQRRFLEAGELERQLEWWRQQFADRPSGWALEPDRPEGAGRPGPARQCPLSLDAEITAPLLRLARKRGSTPFMLLLGAFQALLHRHGEASTVVVGTPVAGRNWVEIEPLVGFFVNTLALRADFPPGQTAEEFLTRVEKRTLDAFTCQDAPYEKVVEAVRTVGAEVGAGGGATGTTVGKYGLFQALFTFQDLEISGLTLPGLTIRVPPLGGERSALFDLSCVLARQGDGLQGGIDSNTAAFDATTVERLARRFHRLLEALPGALDRPLAELPLLTAAEEHQLTVEWGRTDQALGRWQAPGTDSAARGEGEMAEPGVGGGPGGLDERQAEAHLRGVVESRREALSARRQALLARRLRGKLGKMGKGSSHRCLVSLREGAEAREGAGMSPLYLPHPGGGSVLSYRELARTLHPDRPIYAFEAQGLGGGEAPLTTVEAMAERYVEELLAARPGGASDCPWHLGGWSFGGYLAFEMGHRLRELGAPVGGIFLLDAHAEQLGETFFDDDTDLLVASFSDLLALDSAELRRLPREEQFPHAFRRALEAGVLARDLDAVQAEACFAVMRANIRSYATYRPRPYPGPLYLFRAAEPWCPTGQKDSGAPCPEAPADLGWEPLAGGGLTVIAVPGHHYSMLNPPHVTAVARALEQALERWELEAWSPSRLLIAPG